MFTHAVREKGLSLRFDVGEGVPQSLVGDPTRLGQILLNLVGNAMKFTHEGSVTLFVRCVETDPQTVTLGFAVRDPGIGIPAAQSFPLCSSRSSKRICRFPGATAARASALP